MAKIRAYKLAEELGIERNEFVEQAKTHGVELKSAMASIDDLQVVDVRQPGETEGGVIEGAILVPLTLLNQQLSRLDASKPTIVYCAGGFRSSIAASRMLAAGFADVSDLLGGYGAWTAAHEATPA